MVSTLGSALALGSVMGVISYTGRGMFGSSANKPFADRMAYKEEAKSRFRRPLNETINELGEGRGKICTKSHAPSSWLTRLRHIRTRIRGEAETADQRKVWLRRSAAVL